MPSNRRTFLQSVAAIPAVGALLERLRPAAAHGQAAGRDVYRELGVRPLVNAAGTYTNLSASLVPPEVREAMDSAARKYVNLLELHQAAGKRIAALVGCEAALVTAGAASALTLGTAACVAGKDAAKIRRLPDTAGMKNEVVLQKSHRYGYDHAVRNVGVRLVEVETREELERAVGERTAMMLFYNRHDPLGKIKVEEFAALGKKLGVPTFNDAAADVPPVGNFSRFFGMGYDLVTFSGGKGLRGPQCAGLLLGRRDLVEAAAANNNPHTDTVGRTNKVGKEEIVGMWAALERYLKLDHAALWREWERRCGVVAGHLAGLAGVKTEVFVPSIANAVPHLRIAWDTSRLRAGEAVRQLREGEPRIETRPEATEGIEIAVWMLEPGEEEVVGRRLREVLSK
jgi:L-seryl-tRNA(Ser) seleniumtransferase